MPRTVLFIVVIAFLIGRVSAQEPQYGYGTLSGYTYLGNQEQINLGTGNLHIHIPLLTLPGSGRHHPTGRRNYLGLADSA